jgi:hypothetical protein
MTKFISECKNKETRRHMHEAIAFIQMARQKMECISEIYNKKLFAACA